MAGFYAARSRVIPPLPWPTFPPPFSGDACSALRQLDPLWDELFPTEQARIVGLAIERVDIAVDSVNVRLRMDGLSGLAREMLVGGVGVAA